MIVPDWLLYPLATLGAVSWLCCVVLVLWMGVEEVRAWRQERRDLVVPGVGERAA